MNRATLVAIRDRLVTEPEIDGVPIGEVERKKALDYLNVILKSSPEELQELSNIVIGFFEALFENSFKSAKKLCGVGNPDEVKKIENAILAASWDFAVLKTEKRVGKLTRARSSADGAHKATKKKRELSETRWQKRTRELAIEITEKRKKLYSGNELFKAIQDKWDGDPAAFPKSDSTVRRFLKQLFEEGKISLVT